MSSEDDLTSQDLWKRCDAKRAVARRMVEDREFCREAWIASGAGVEFALKALICARQKFNVWPSREHRPDLHTHDLRKLFRAAGVDLKAAPKQVQPAIRQVLDWERNHDYSAAQMPRRVARDMVEAAFGAGGVVDWLRRL